MQTNYKIGHRIVKQEQHGSGRAEYGKELLKDLSDRLTDEFGAGFSRSNLEYMRRFYLTYQNGAGKKSQTVSGISEETGMTALLSIPQTPFRRSQLASSDCLFGLTWSYYVFLLGMNDQEWSFYEVEASQQGWTLRELKRQYNSGLFERLALSLIDIN